eukprot:CAMPEP_0168555418 /NCGR_PEP_ID=MMETSP0413-20121227/8325_1 /TAXON_ID=136452 /ORGANISM="Filamoeba nolandi, Strain NC-AS-23-1" /LENGTH=165 /DNA_ID=CAMNT_0008586269 /DNA_START=64 /DNA_END=558 /DNA_ORIENTATION=+
MVLPKLAFWAKKMVVRVGEAGGPIGFLKKNYYQSTTKTGKLVGTDQYGHKYFTQHLDEYNPLGQDRWVEPPDGKQFDPSRIPAIWHGWLHHINDFSGAEMQQFVPKYQSLHKPNVTGTFQAYTPHNYLLNDTNKFKRKRVPFHQTEVVKQLGSETAKQNSKFSTW